MSTQPPTTDEATQLAIRSYRGIELGLGEADPGAAACEGQTEGFAATSTWDEAALACARTIRMRSNAELTGASGAFAAKRPR
jgi:hypothetical protein